MVLLNATAATYTLYLLLFGGFAVALLYGFKMLYNAIETKDEDAIRRAKFVLMFAAIAIICIAIVCFAITGKLPIN